MNFECGICSYKTCRCSNFRRHLDSNAHAVNCKNNISCHKCLKRFNNNAGLGKHARSCEVELMPRMRNTLSIENNSPIETQINGDVNVTIGSINVNGADANFVSTISDLIKDISTDWILKHVLKRLNPNVDLFDKLDELNESLDLEHAKLVELHNQTCKYDTGDAYVFISELPEGSIPPGRGCYHLINGFYLEDGAVMEALGRVLMKDFETFHLLHKNTLSTDNEILLVQRLERLYGIDEAKRFFEMNERKHLYKLSPYFDFGEWLRKLYREFARSFGRKIVAAKKERQEKYQRSWK